jgi:Ca2+-binding EF-hand superfamily protein
MGELLGRIASTYLNRKTQTAERRFLSRSLSLCDLQTMDTDRNGEVDKAEFLTYMLVALQKVNKEDIDELSTLFHHLDKTGTGFLSKRDIVKSGFQSSFQASLRMAVFDPAVLRELEDIAMTPAES